jgi:uncharacterized metal-binding protein
MDINDHKKLYSEADIRTMQVAEESRLPGKNRVEEIKNYARISGIKRIGIANCLALQKEANKLKQALEGEFEVIAIDCKIGKIPSAELLNNQSKGFSCNPAGQADYLSQNNTELNISFGLCMGHDIIFMQKSKAPVTTLIVKDRQYKHNPYEAFKDTDKEQG